MEPRDPAVSSETNHANQTCSSGDQAYDVDPEDRDGRTEVNRCIQDEREEYRSGMGILESWVPAIGRERSRSVGDLSLLAFFPILP